MPAGVRFVTEPIAAFADRLRAEDGKNVWMMGGGEIIASFLDAGAIDEFILTVVPTFIGEGIPLIAPRHRHSPLGLLGVQSSRTASFSCTTRSNAPNPRPRFKNRQDQAGIATIE